MFISFIYRDTGYFLGMNYGPHINGNNNNNNNKYNNHSN